MIQFGDKAMLLPECAAEVPDLPGGGGLPAALAITSSQRQDLPSCSFLPLIDVLICTYPLLYFRT